MKDKSIYEKCMQKRPNALPPLISLVWPSSKAGTFHWHHQKQLFTKLNGKYRAMVLNCPHLETIPFGSMLLAHLLSPLLSP
uniref:Clone 836 transcribed RNA sequence n=1 Tax=Plectreurys tristis TaxID=33319 RepID=A0A0C4W4D4_PLETR|nr:hypothetical protein [Plectreurys tristis]